MDNRKKKGSRVKESVFERLGFKKISRRGFVKLCAISLGSLALDGALLKFAFGRGETSKGRDAGRVKTSHDLVAVKGVDPYAMTTRAVEGLGGMERFVKKNSVVLIKPNIGWDRSAEQAANTNPQVVSALIDMSFKAGAKRVNIFDNTCNDPRRCYENSGIEKAALERGAKVYLPDSWDVLKAEFSYDSPMKNWPIFRDAVECDTFINVPILKHHSLAGLTLSMKNLMGVCAGNRGLIHLDMGRKLAHLADFIKPELTVIDAYRVLAKNGPSGGNLGDVLDMKIVMAGPDPVLCDSYAAKLMDKDPLSISYINEAMKLNLGTSDIASADILEIRV